MSKELLAAKNKNKNSCHNIMVIPSKIGKYLIDIWIPILILELLLISHDATSIYPLSEWRMWEYCLCLKEKSLSVVKRKRKRRIILNLMVLLYNFQCSPVRQNEIIHIFIMHIKKIYYYSHHRLPTEWANLTTCLVNKWGCVIIWTNNENNKTQFSWCQCATHILLTFGK